MVSRPSQPSEFLDGAWEHALGGMHAMICHHGAISHTPQWCSAGCCYHDTALRCGYVEGVRARGLRGAGGSPAALMDAAGTGAARRLSN